MTHNKLPLEVIVLHVNMLSIYQSWGLAALTGWWRDLEYKMHFIQYNIIPQ